MRKLALLFLSALFSQLAPAQDRCVPMMMSEERINSFENWITKKKQVKSQATQSLRTSATVYTIPVVFHIIHKGEPLGTGYNISNARIQEQIDILNEDFRKANPRSSSVPDIFKPVEADIEIEFVLARQMPDGQPTNGIVRKQGSQNSYFYPSNAVKSESYWPSEDYLNIWVADVNVLGWASFPEGSGLVDITNPETVPERDGVVIDAQYIGTNLNTGGLFESYGQTVTHEIGHFLGLYHIWGSGCISDDYCDDTPIASEDNSGIGSPCTFPGPNSCPSDEFPDMFMNFMDYTDDACMSMFSEDQKTRMRIVLENSPRRESLLTSPGLEYPIGILGLDMAVYSVDNLPIVSCEESLAPSIVFSNFGINEVTSFTVDYTLNGNTSTMNFENLSLGTGEQYVINPGLTGITTGEQEVSWEITEVNGSIDENDLNDFKELKFSIRTDQLLTPFKETFSVHDWYATSPNGITEWQEIDIDGNNAYYVPAYNALSSTDSWLVSPSFSLVNYQQAGLFFKLSYGKRQTSDLLKVMVSSGCSDDFQTIWSNSLGSLNFASADNAWTPIDQSDWSELFIDLSAYKGLPEVRLAFVFENNGGNNLYLDDVELTNNNDPFQPRLKSGKFLAYPNPAREQFNVTLNLPASQDIRVQLISITGAIVKDEKYEQLLNETFSMETGQLFGTYFLRILGKDINHTQRILIGR